MTTHPYDAAFWDAEERRYAWHCRACGVRTKRGPAPEHQPDCPNRWPQDKEPA